MTAVANTQYKELTGLESLKDHDSEVYDLIEQEKRRQWESLELIASENFTSRAVMEALGSALTNKYAEGTPGHRYYGGCEHVDIIETIACERAKKIFNAEHANVQPHSGAQANTAVFFALLNPGDTIMGMDLSHGGHLTHGSPVNISGKYFNVVSYGVDKERERINYDDLERQALEVKPKMIIAGASAYSRIIDFERIGDIAKKAEAIFFVDMAHVSGLVAGGVYPNPVPYADIVTSTTHKSLRGPRGGFIICKSNPEIEKKVNSMVFPGTQGGPLMHVIAAKAVAFKEALQPSFKEYQQQILKNANAMAEQFIKRGYKVVSGGTDDHLFLVDFIDKGITGKDVDAALGRANITVNKNSVPNDPQSPFVTSGIRVGTPAPTTRGFKEAECKDIVDWMCDVIENMDNDEVINEVKNKVVGLCKKFPVYGKSQSKAAAA